MYADNNITQFSSEMGRPDKQCNIYYHGFRLKCQKTGNLERAVSVCWRLCESDWPSRESAETSLLIRL